MTVVTQTPSNEFHDNMTVMFFGKLAFRLDGSPAFEVAESKTSVSSRRQATFFRKVAFRLDASPLSEHIPGSAGNGVIDCGSDPPTSRAGGQDDGSYTNSLK